MTTNPIDTIHRLIDHTDACDLTDPYRADDAHDLAAMHARDLLCDPTMTPSDLDEYPIDATTLHTLRHAITDALDSTSPDTRTALSMIALTFSLCPLHMIDYAICFDDDDPDCAAIRAAFPSHDT